jgi:hypothetical protein
MTLLHYSEPRTAIDSRKRISKTPWLQRSLEATVLLRGSHAAVRKPRPEVTVFIRKPRCWPEATMILGSHVLGATVFCGSHTFKGAWLRWRPKPRYLRVSFSEGLSLTIPGSQV